MRGSGKLAGADTTMAMRTTLDVLTRSVVQRARADGAIVLAITDSVHAKGGDPARAEALRRALQGKRVLLHLGPDGATRVLDGGGMMSQETSAMLSQMPATLPAEPIAIGGTWEQRSAVPLPGDPEGAPRGTLVATFRLDSLAHHGDHAWISMRGTLARPPERANAGRGATLTSSGTVTGIMRIDRRRGFLTLATATIVVRSVVAPPPGSRAAPMTFQTRVVQRLESVDKR